MTWLVLHEDALFEAYAAAAMVAGEGFLEAGGAQSLAVTDTLFLYLLGLLALAGVGPAAGVWVLNTLSLGWLGLALARWRGWAATAAFLCLLSLTHKALVSPGAYLFLALLLTAVLSLARAGGGWWAGLAVAARPDAAIAWLLGAWERWRAGGKAWLAKGVAAPLAVAAVNLAVWGTAVPVTLGAKKAYLARESILGAAHEPFWPLWAVPLFLLLLPGWSGRERALLAVALALAAAWLLAGVPPYSADLYSYGLCWLALVGRAARGRRWALPALAALALATWPHANLEASRRADRFSVVARIAPALPARGCTLATYHFGYLRAHRPRACLVDGGGSLDPETGRIMAEAGTVDVLLATHREKIDAILQFHPPGSDPLPSVRDYRLVAKVEGEGMMAVLYERPPAPAGGG